MLSEFADLDTTKQALREIGFESIDDYFSGFTEDQRHTDFYDQAQRSVLKSLEETLEGPQLQIMTEAIKAGLHVDFIDGGRYMDDDVIDNLDELSVRNAYMTKKLSGEKKYSEPGVLGLFGLEHSRTYAGTDGTLQPAMQQTLNFPQNRVHETFALYHDHTTGEYFFPWSHLGAMANQTAEMSLSFPYKKTAADQQYKARTNKSHVIIDASGGAADERIKRIVEQRPSTSIIFKPSDTHGLEYISGTRLNIDHLPTKAYLFGNENSDSSKLDRLLSHAALKLDADLADISIKKIYVGSPQTPVEEGSQRGSKSIKVNSDLIHSSNKHPQEEGTNKTATTSQPSAGKDRATAPDPLTLAPPSDRSHAADFIAEARAEQMISPESKEYLDQVKLVIAEQLNTGPVLLGEYHLLPEALLLTKQLISEDRVKRLVLESPPLSELLHDQEAANISHYMATKKISSTGELVATLPELGDSSDHLERVLHWQEKIKPFADELKSSGWASLDTYLANFQPSDAASERFRQAQYLFNEATAAAGNDEYNQLASHAISSGTQIAFVDGGRTRNEYTDNGSIAVYDGDSFHLRNLDMANRIKPDGDEIAAGTLGLFGLDHLKTSVSNQGTLNPALQELLNIPEDRVHQLMPMFTDLQSGKEYFPSLIQPRASHAGASITHPFKLLPEYNQQNGEQRLYQERKNRSHVIVNLVGDKAASEIAGLQDAHPSSNITFSGDRKGLRYESGIAVNFSSDIKTKVYILSDPAKPTLSTEFVLSQLGKMLGRDEKNFKVKEGLLESDSDSGADTPL